MSEERAPFVEAPALKRFGMHLRHGFFGRAGGVSTGVYTSLNCGPGSRDDPMKVAENRRRAAAALGGSGEKLITLRQVHSAKAVTTREVWKLGETPEADAVATNTPGLVLGVLAADCAPVLLCDPHAGVIGAAHAGWRGAVGGVVEAAMGAMASLGADPSRTVAAVGPCLTQASFEVGPDVEGAVLDVTPWAERLFILGQGDRRHFDLKAYVLGRLARLGVAHADALADDTLSEPEAYFSYRGMGRRGEPDGGRNISAIMLI